MGILVARCLTSLVASFGIFQVLKGFWFGNGNAQRKKELVHRQTLMLVYPPDDAAALTVFRVPPVHVLVAIEALCPDSQRFIQESLTPTYATLGPRVMNLQVVPFGNAVLDVENHTVRCQHGPGECDANLYQECAVSMYPQPSRHLPFINCLFYALPMGRHDVPFDPYDFELCANFAALDWIPLQACHNNRTVAWQVVQQAAADTPKHNHVPWVEINGDYMDEDKNDLLTEVCKAYAASGGTHPACHSVQLQSSVRAK